jgi:HK97 family phage portal protein
MFPGQAAWTDWKYETYAREAYQANPYVYRAVRMLVTALAGIPWEVLLAGDKPAGEDHGLVKLLKTPNPLVSFPEWLEEFLGCLILSGNTYPMTVLGGGKPRELYVLPPNAIKVIPTKQVGAVGGYVYSHGDTEDTYLVDEAGWCAVRQFKFWNPLDQVYGQSPLVAAANSIDTNNEARSYTKTVLRNMGVAGLTILYPDGVTLSKEDKERLRESLGQWKGSGRGETLILTGGATLDRGSMTVAEIGAPELSKLSAREVAVALGIPPQLLGDTESQTYSNYQEARRAFYTETVLPLADVLAAMFTSWLGSRFDGASVTYDGDQVEALREDQDKAHTRVREDYKVGLLSRDEAREALGYDPEPEQNVVLVFGGVSPLEAVVGSGGLIVDPVSKLSGADTAGTGGGQDGDGGGT